jgi:hypothetical protein
VADFELPITEPRLLERLAMDDREFAEYVGEIAAALPARTYEADALVRAIGYPWERPEGSYRLTPAGVDPLEEMTAAGRDDVIDEYVEAGDERLPLLAIGSNGAPQVLERKFAHFPDERDRAVLALTGRLHDFDIGVAAQPALYGSMPATLFPSPGTAVCATVLWVTPAQFTQLTWSELSYRPGRLRTRFEVDEGGAAFDEVLVFVSRFGAFCIDGEPIALAAIPATRRNAQARTQEQLLDAVAELAIGPGANAEALVRALFEDLGEILPRLVETVHRESLPFSSESWTQFDPRP